MHCVKGTQPDTVVVLC